MRLFNESPIGLATILGIIPALVAAIVLIILVITNGGDIAAAEATVPR